MPDRSDVETNLDLSLARARYYNARPDSVEKSEAWKEYRDLLRRTIPAYEAR